MRTYNSDQRPGRSFAMMTALALLLMLAVTSCAGESGSNGINDARNSRATNLPAIQEKGDIVIPIGEISETAQFYPITVDGTRMEVVAVKAPDGTIRTAFNTCQICSGSPKAYFEQGGTALQCQNCGNWFPMDRVGIEAGGCNPVPIFDEEKVVTGESITIAYATLQENAYRFPSNWKQ